jgi:cysteine desulfurase
VIYLDYAAATPVDEVVLAAMAPYWRDTFYNPSSPYASALDVRRDYEAAKADIAAVLAVKSDELIMTAGATESINLACMGAGHIVTSLMEHPAVVEAARRTAHTFVAPDATGMIRPEVIAAAITDETTLVSIAYANHEVGTIQPLREIADVIHQERTRRAERGIITPIYFHTDASQAASQLDLSVSRLGADMMTLNSGKVYGPKQVGLLWADRSVHLISCH